VFALTSLSRPVLACSLPYPLYTRFVVAFFGLQWLALAKGSCQCEESACLAQSRSLFLPIAFPHPFHTGLNSLSGMETRNDDLGYSW